MSNLRYPAVPLITVDPHFNIWSMTDKLYDDVTRFWTGRRQNMLGLIKVDGVLYRFMGKVNADNRYHKEPDCLEQTSVRVYPMRSVYIFENSEIRLTLTFMSPLLLDDLKLLSRPVSYISYKIENLDGKEHQATLYFELDCEIGVDDPNQSVTYEIYDGGIRCGKGERDVLIPTKTAGELEYGGDDRCIDWGWLHIFSGEGFEPTLKITYQLFNPPGMRSDRKQSITENSFSFDNKIVYIGLEKEFALNTKPICGFVCAGYDDIHSVKYFSKMIDAYYKKERTYVERRLRNTLKYVSVWRGQKRNFLTKRRQ